MTSALRGRGEGVALRERVAMGEAQFRAARTERDWLAAEVKRLRVDSQWLQTRIGELAAQVK